MIRIIPALLSAILIGSLLTGCSFFKNRSSASDNAYKKSQEARPLEVPPGLDMPNTSAALTIPKPSSTPAARDTSDTEISQRPSVINSAAPPTSLSAVAPGAGVTLSGDGLRVADTPASTWSRVGLALVRSGTATIVSSDEAGLTYQIESTGKRTEKAGWFKNAITFGHANKEVPTKVSLTVRVTAENDGSRVSIDGEAGSASRDAADRILKALRERMS